LGGRGRRISEFEASLVYKVSSRTARAIQRNPVSKKTKQSKAKQNHEFCRCLQNQKGWEPSELQLQAVESFLTEVPRTELRSSAKSRKCSYPLSQFYPSICF
jgi:site-specific recombinase XerD